MDIQLNSLDSINGRKLIRNIYFDLKYNKLITGLNLIFILWKICINKNNIVKYSSDNIEIAHSLGLIRGTSLWMEEIFNRYYFSTLNAFVYFGAAILLLLVGLRKFSTLINDTIVIAGFVLEASLLVLMFIFLLFNPKDELFEENDNSKQTEKDELIDEIGEIARDFANASFQLEKMNNSFSFFEQSQKDMIFQLSELTKNIEKSLKPNNEMLETMKETNILFNDLKNNIQALNEEIQQSRLTNIETVIKNQLEKLLLVKIHDDKATNK
jgi:methyl-accepting chemotaxis protein